MTEASNVNRASHLPDAGEMLQRALRRARWTTFWERVWPPLVTLATAIGIFLAVSWLGIWLWLPPTGRAIVLSSFLVLTAVATFPLLRVRFPTRYDGLRRLDRNAGLPHRPATAIGDELATPKSDPGSAALWRAHVERALLTARALKAGRPAPRLDLRDPMAVRALVLMLVVATFIAAGGERGHRLTAAFDWHGVVVPANFRLDAWVSPPSYTGKPPVILPGLRPGEQTQTTAALSVPAGSVLVIRASGKVQFDVATAGGVAEVPAEQRPQAPTGTLERRYLITDRGTAMVRGLSNEDLTYAFNAIPDKPPTIALAKDPESQPGGSLQLNYKMEDDYGVVEAKALFALKGAKDGNGGARPLFGPPEMQLALPQARVKNGVGQTTKDLSDHPWAGAEVVMTLTARDEANNEGHSAPHELRLPERPFAKQLARSVIEQRRDLALDAENRDRVLIALDALAMAPDKFMPELGHYLGLRALYWQLAQAKSDDDLREVVKQMWAYATMLEDGNMADASARLKNAEEALRNALERGASDEELKRLMDELRAAMNQFLQALAEELRKNPQMARPLDQNTRQLRSQDLQSMLDRLEQMMRNGAKDAARQLLDQLSQMMQNLQMARPGQMDQGDDDMMSMLDELGDMIRKQQQLRDKTFRQGQEQRGQRGQQGQRGQRGQQGQQGQQGQRGDPNAFGELRQDQQALRDQLKKLLEEMKKRGLGQNQQGQEGQQGQDGQQGQQGQGQQQGQGGDDLADADGAMGDAENALGEGNSDRAIDGQGRAIDAMRKGAQGLAQQLQQQMGQGQGPGPYGQPGRLGPGRAQQDTDPLGRPLRGRDYGDDTTVKVPGEIDAQRARRIIEELRRRFGEAFRPQLELDYIERLLKDN